MLKVENLVVKYGAIIAVQSISFEAKKGQIVALLGANGSGKSTALRTISGLRKVAQGHIRFDDQEIANLRPHEIVARGVSQVPEGRMIFTDLTVRENLEMGAYLRRDKPEIKKDLEHIFTIFPRLAERINQVGGTLSGGEQQMLAISRALMARPKLLLLDEPSLGLAPKLVQSIFQNIVEINQQLGLTILLVEQNAHMALKIANYAYVLETGHIILEGPATELAANADVKKAYLGLA